MVKFDTYHGLIKKVVNLITTVHSAETFKKQVRSKKGSDHVREVDKPCAVQAYSQHMGGIDRADKAMTFYMVLHRCCKWLKNVFFYLLEISFCNALIIWRAQSRKRINAEMFRLKIVRGMLRHYERPSELSKFGNHGREKPGRLTGGNHFIGLNSGLLSGGKRSKPDCSVCSDRKHKRHQTQYICKQCEEPMCPYPCFERLHTREEYRVLCKQELHQS
jgi:hypothetical protein